MKPTYIWGAGHYGVLTALDCEQRGIEVAGFIDSNASKIKYRKICPLAMGMKEVINFERVGASTPKNGYFITFPNIQFFFPALAHIPVKNNKPAFIGTTPVHILQGLRQTIG